MERLVRYDSIEGREPPAALLLALRQIDPSVELVYTGDTRWLLGSVQKTDERKKMGEYMLEMESRRSPASRRNVFLGKLALQGFSPIAEYFGSDPSGTVHDSTGRPCSILDDFRERDWWWRHERDRIFRQRLEHSTGEVEAREAEALRQEYMRTDGRAHYQREVKNRVTFGYGGQTGGAGRIITL